MEVISLNSNSTASETIHKGLHSILRYDMEASFPGISFIVLKLMLILVGIVCPNISLL